LDRIEHFAFLHFLILLRAADFLNSCERVRRFAVIPATAYAGALFVRLQA
jgi:hypothetical protein